MKENRRKNRVVILVIYSSRPSSDGWLKTTILFPVMSLWVEPSWGWVQPDDSSPLPYMIRALTGGAGLCRALHTLVTGVQETEGGCCEAS